MGGITSSFPPVVMDVFPRYATSPCIGIPPAAAQCVGSWPKYMCWRAGRPVLFQGRSNPMYKHPLPLTPVSATVWKISSKPSEGWGLLPASHRPLLWGGDPGILMMSLSPVANHTPRMPLLHLPVPSPLSSSTFSGMHPACRERCQGGGGWITPTVQTCHRQGSRGGGGSLPPESLYFPARGGARSESGGW